MERYRREREAKEVEAKRKRERKIEPHVSNRGLPCERLFLDLVELLESLLREKSLQSLGRGSEMPRDAGSLEQAVRGHGRCCQGGSVSDHTKRTPELPGAVERSTKSQMDFRFRRTH